MVEKPKMLAVEGRDEVNFFKAFLDKLNLSDIQLEDIAGEQNFSNRLEAFASLSGFSNVVSLGIVRDADNFPSGKFQSICAILTRLQLPVPSNPWQFQTGHPRVIVMIMPDGTSHGMLEDLCLSSVSTEPEMVCVDHYLACLRNQGIISNNPSQSRISKAKIQTFLASKPVTGIPLGVATLKRYWPLNSQTFDSVRTVLQNF